MLNRQRVGEALLPAIAYGDAAGLPVETKSHAEITAKFGRITELIPVNENPFYVGEFDKGTWSDDTQLSLAVALSLTEKGGFDIRSIADEHAIAYHQTPQITKPSGQKIKRGWGGSTTKAVERYMARTPAERNDPVEWCGVEDAAGNGVIMKMAPLAYWLIAHEAPEQQAYTMLDSFTTFTHDSPVARVATRVHYDVLRKLASGDRILKRLGGFAHTRALLHEQLAHDNSAHLSDALWYLTAPHPLRDSEILSSTDGKGFYVPQTLAMAYGAFRVGEGRFADSVYTAVNLGGDTDSTASIVAAMSVFKWGGMTEQPDDLTELQDYDYLTEISQKLAAI